MALAAFFVAMTILAQATISGTVTDGEIGAPLPGANVLLKGTDLGVYADFDSNFSLEVPRGSGTLIISCLGFIVRQIEFSGTTNLATNEIELRANVYNLFDADYINQKDSFGYYLGIGRTFNIGARYNF